MLTPFLDAFSLVTYKRSGKSSLPLVFLLKYEIRKLDKWIITYLFLTRLH
jgi:hypothetical protein